MPNNCSVFADNNDDDEISVQNDENSVQYVRECVNEHLTIPEEIKNELQNLRDEVKQLKKRKC